MTRRWSPATRRISYEDIEKGVCGRRTGVCDSFNISFCKGGLDLDAKDKTGPPPPLPLPSLLCLRRPLSGKGMFVLMIETSECLVPSAVPLLTKASIERYESADSELADNRRRPTSPSYRRSRRGSGRITATIGSLRISCRGLASPSFSQRATPTTVLAGLTLRVAANDQALRVNS
jgi:hypothetical protein